MRLICVLFFCNISWCATIVINPGAALSGNGAALGAFNRAAQTWESLFSDPVQINIAANLANMGSPSIIGSASPVVLYSDYDTVRSFLVVDALNEPDDTIVAALPSAAEFTYYSPSGILASGGIAATKANFKALGIIGLDAGFGANDATITFNTGFAFDFDNSNGVAAGAVDFESVALHEIGHALGFMSAVDDVDYGLANNLTGTFHLMPMDLFRFGQSTNPANASQFTTATRELRTGVAAAFDDTQSRYQLSTGERTGDGRQASHWKDNNLSGLLIGTMDPTLGSGQVLHLSPADIRALDVIGWDNVPEPGTYALCAGGLLVLFSLRRIRARG
jgi:hypothetical protein